MEWKLRNIEIGEMHRTLEENKAKTHFIALSLAKRISENWQSTSGKKKQTPISTKGGMVYMQNDPENKEQFEMDVEADDNNQSR